MSVTRDAAQTSALTRRKTQGIATDQFLYFFLRLRKSEVRRIVQRVRALYPGETPEQLARHLINSQSVLSFVGGALLHLPQLLPVAGGALKYAGMAGGASVMTRMQMFLILEIALLFEQDIDDRARVPEMLTVVAASAAQAATPMLISQFQWNPLYAIPASGASATLVTQLIGHEAIRFYTRKLAQQRQAQHAAEVAA